MNRRFCVLLLVIPVALCLGLGACAAESNENAPIVRQAESLGLTDSVENGVALDGQNLYVKLADNQDGYVWTETTDGEGLVLAEGPVNADSVGSQTDESAYLIFVGEVEGQQTVHLTYGNGPKEANSCTINVRTGPGGTILEATYVMADGQSGTVTQE